MTEDEIRKQRQREANKRWRENRPEAYKASYDKQNRVRYERDKEDGFARQREYRERNAEAVRERMREWAKKNREYLNSYARRNYLKQKYGITPEERDAMFQLQGSCCACCGGTDAGNKSGWVVDHCHVGGGIRGILCHHCNVALGNVRDNIEHLRSLISYLELHNAND